MTPDRISRREFLNSAGSLFVALSAMFSGINLRKAQAATTSLSGEKDDLPLLSMKSDFDRERLLDLSPRQKRIHEILHGLFDASTFPSPDLGLRLGEVPPHWKEWGWSNGKLKLATNGEKIPPIFSLSAEIDHKVRELGIHVTLEGLVKLFYQRYEQILKNPEGELSKTIDPSRADFLTLTTKYSEKTGFPADVIRAIWWREMLGNGTYPEIHGGPYGNSGLGEFHRDGPMAPFWGLFAAPASFNGGENFDGENLSRLGISHTEVAAFAVDYRTRATRSTNNLIVTHVPVELARVDAELNIIFGLILYLQSIYILLEDSSISNIFQQYQDPNKGSAELKNSEKNWTLWAFAYSIYHHGGVPSQQNANEHLSDEEKQYFYLPADLFMRTMKSQSWNDSSMIGKSALQEEGAEENLEFFYPFSLEESKYWNELSSCLEMVNSLKMSELDLYNEKLIALLLFLILLNQPVYKELFVQQILLWQKDLSVGEVEKIIDDLADHYQYRGIDTFPIKDENEPFLVFRQRLSKSNPTYAALRGAEVELRSYGNFAVVEQMVNTALAVAFNHELFYAIPSSIKYYQLVEGQLPQQTNENPTNIQLMEQELLVFAEAHPDLYSELQAVGGVYREARNVVDDDSFASLYALFNLMEQPLLIQLLGEILPIGYGDEFAKQALGFLEFVEPVKAILLPKFRKRIERGDILTLKKILRGGYDYGELWNYRADFDVRFLAGLASMGWLFIINFLPIKYSTFNLMGDDIYGSRSRFFSPTEEDIVEWKRYGLDPKLLKGSSVEKDDIN